MSAAGERLDRHELDAPLRTCRLGALLGRVASLRAACSELPTTAKRQGPEDLPPDDRAGSKSEDQDEKMKKWFENLSPDEMGKYKM